LRLRRMGIGDTTPGVPMSNVFAVGNKGVTVTFLFLGYGGRPVAMPGPIALMNGTQKDDDNVEAARWRHYIDHGGIDFRSVSIQDFARRISPRDDRLYNRMKDRQLEWIEKFVILDGSDRFDHWDERDYSIKGCVRPKWSYASHPACNVFHDLDLLSFDDFRFLGHGSFRSSLLLPVGDSGTTVLKTNRLEDDAQRHFDEYAFSQTQMEALVMLQTHSSNRTMNIYGYCGTDTLTEPGEEIEDSIIPNHYAWYIQAELDKIQVEDVVPMNKYTPEEKLEMCITLAESIAELHGNREGPLMSHDLGLDQFLRSKKDGLIKLNDFNKAHVLEFDPEANEYCKIWSHQGGT